MQYHESLYYLQDGAENSSSNLLVLDWTAERERIISVFCMDFENLVMNIAAFTSSTKIFQKLIDSGTDLHLLTEGDISEEKNKSSGTM
jgi:hypothetical protein